MPRGAGNAYVICVAGSSKKNKLFSWLYQFGSTADGNLCDSYLLVYADTNKQLYRLSYLRRKLNYVIRLFNGLIVTLMNFESNFYSKFTFTNHLPKVLVCVYLRPVIEQIRNRITFFPFSRCSYSDWVHIRYLDFGVNPSSKTSPQSLFYLFA